MLCDKLKEYRKNCGLSQLQVAAELNVDRATYAYYESGRTQPSLENLKRLAKIFDVHLYELLEVGEPMVRPVFRDSGGFDEPGTPFDAYLGILSAEERELISRFRMLEQEKQDEVMALVRPTGGRKRQPTENK